MANRTTTSILLVVLILGLVFFSGCSKRGRVKPEPSSVAIHSMKNIDNEVGHNITVRGTARNAKLGAIVLIDELPIHVAGLERWKAALIGKPIEVTGTLAKTDGHLSQTNEFGLVSAGTDGPIYTLVNPKVSGQ